MEKFVMEFAGGKELLCEDRVVPEAGEIIGKYVVQAKQKLDGVWHLSMDTLEDAGFRNV